VREATIADYVYRKRFRRAIGAVNIRLECGCSKWRSTVAVLPAAGRAPKGAIFRGQETHI